MITNSIIKFVAGKNPDYKNVITRTKLGSAAGLVGIITNLALTLLKAGIGILSGSISIVADSFNNLTDMASSVVSLIGIRLSGKARDEEHPYGHGRGEYVATLIVALAILFVGLSLLKSSVENIIKPTPVEFNLVGFIVLVIFIFVKFWMYLFYKSVGEKISSSPLKAASLDSISDVLVTSVVALSFILSKYTSLPIDGIGGAFVSIFILKSGYELITETISDIIGIGPTQEFREEIKSLFLSREEILGIHDLQVYDYGHDSKFATVDAVVCKDANVVEIHNIFTEIEHIILDKFGILLTIHMDIEGCENDEDRELGEIIEKYMEDNKNIISYHDQHIFHVDNIKHIMVHIITNGCKLLSNEDEEKEIKKLEEYLKSEYGQAEYDIILDKDY